MPLLPDHQKALVDFFHSGVCLKCNTNDFIVRPGETLSGVFLIESGLVKSFDITKYGDENLLAIRKAGEIIGMTAAITGDVRRIMYSALTPTVLWYIPSERFVDFLETTPEAALPLLTLTTEMYRAHSERILTLEYRTVRERLISFLLNTAHHFGTETEDGIILDVPLRHQDIASSISATRETTGREIANLERRGLLTNRLLCITLHDVEALKKFL